MPSPAASVHGIEVVGLKEVQVELSLLTRMALTPVPPPSVALTVRVTAVLVVASVVPPLIVKETVGAVVSRTTVREPVAGQPARSAVETA